MNYKIVVGLLFGISNCFAMNNPVDNKIGEQVNDMIKYQKYAQRVCDVFTGKEQKLLLALSEIVPQKENEKRYELVAKCLEEIWGYKNQSRDSYTLLMLTGHLLDFHNTFHTDFNGNNPLVKDAIDRIIALTKKEANNNESNMVIFWKEETKLLKILES